MSEARTVVVPMPHMGVSVEEGTVIEWLKAPGEEVAAEEPLCAIATDKVDTEVVAPAAGVLARQLAEVGANVPVGAPLAEMAVGAGAAAFLGAAGSEGGGSPDAAETPASAESPNADGAPTANDEALLSFGSHRETKLNSAQEGGEGIGLAARAAAGRDAFGRFDPKAAAAAVLSVLERGASRVGGAAAGAGARPASPVARRMASRHGVDLAAVPGSGRNGRIRKSDVEAAIAAGGAVPVELLSDSERKSTGPADLPPGYAEIPHQVVPASRVRQLIAAHMTRSRQTAAHMTTEVDVDLGATVAARAELNAARAAAGEPKLSYLPFIARAACAALGEHPQLNASFLGDRIVHWQAVNLGVAVDTVEGLLVPVVRDCDRLDVAAIGAAVADLAERARGRRLAADDLAGGTFTLSNPGSVGAVSAPAIINQPQVAILGVPAIQRRPWVITDAAGDEAIAIRPILRLAVTFDHRALDGADATRFAVTLKAHLESWGPEAYARGKSQPK